MLLIGLEATSEGVVMGLALFYGGLVQLLAGMWEFINGNLFAAVAFSSYGGFWMSFAALFIKAFGFLDGYTNANDLHNDLGIYLLAWAIFSLLMTIGAHRTHLCLMTLLFIVFITFMCLSMSHFTHNFPDRSLRLKRAGGCFGIIAAILAWYCAMAGFLTKEKTSLFTLPVGELDPIWRQLGLLAPEKVEIEHQDHDDLHSVELVASHV